MWTGKRRASVPAQPTRFHANSNRGRAINLDGPGYHRCRSWLTRAPAGCGAVHDFPIAIKKVEPCAADPSIFLVPWCGGRLFSRPQTVLRRFAKGERVWGRCQYVSLFEEDFSQEGKWWPETGLNRRRRPFQGRALPLSYLASVHDSVVWDSADIHQAAGELLLLQP